MAFFQPDREQKFSVSLYQRVGFFELSFYLDDRTMWNMMTEEWRDLSRLMSSVPLNDLVIFLFVCLHNTITYTLTLGVVLIFWTD